MASLNRRCRCWIACAVAAVASSKALWAQQTNRADAALTESESVDLLYLGADRAWRIRLAVRLEGEPPSIAWRDYLRDTLRAHVAADGAGVARESALVWAELVGTAIGDAAPRAAVEATLPADAAHAVLESLVDAVATAAPAVRWRDAPPAAASTLFLLLDVNKDHRLSVVEFAQARARLIERDFNDDEILAADELRVAPPPSPESDLRPRADATVQPASARSSGILLVSGRSWEEEVLPALLRWYDSDHDGSLRCADEAGEWMLSGSLSPEADGNSDRQLDAEELQRFSAAEPDAVVPLPLGGARGARDRTRLASRNGVRLRRRLDGGYQLRLSDAVINIARNNRDPALRFEEQFSFNTLDADANAYLDQTETQNAPLLSMGFAQLDANQDGMVVREEFKTYVTRLGEAAAARVSVSVEDRGQDLLGLLDLDQDRRLTPRELQSAAQAIGAVDRDADGQLAGAEIPRQLSIEIVRGEPTLPGMMNPARANSAAVSAAERTGPEWFQRMDRNADGDLTLREFLGDRTQFERLDRDGDGLISIVEATTSAE